MNNYKFGIKKMLHTFNSKCKKKLNKIIKLNIKKIKLLYQ